MRDHIRSGQGTCSLVGGMTPHGWAATEWFQKYGRILGPMIFTLAGLGARTPEARVDFCKTRIAHVLLGYTMVTPHVPRMSTITYDGMAFERIDEELKAPPGLVPSVLGSQETHPLDIAVLVDFGGRHEWKEVMEKHYFRWMGLRLEWPEEFRGAPLHFLKGLLSAWISDST